VGRARRPGLARPLLRVAAAVALGAAVRGRVPSPDERVRALLASRRSALADRALPVLTDLGSMYAAAGCAAALATLGRRRLARDVLGAAAAAWGVAQAAKVLFDRPRPYEAGDARLLVRPPAGRSYPSGHPAVAAAVAEVLAPELPALARGSLERLPRFVGFTRVYVGAHYPTDVVGGILLGRAVGELWRRLANRSLLGSRSRVSRTPGGRR
jgi:membrane-associated phospholipid phosphatase